jgi:alkanesulfonate monooxygenase SsuD/methylene tetrahydromethanopterin reductase-like flavin-dependent oxidoreductase (luciferase family)
VPILVGGHSRAAARRAARYGDGFYPLTPIVDTDVSKIDFVKEIDRLIVMLREECDKVGRKFDGFEISTSAAADLDIIKRLEDIGVGRVSTALAASDRDGITWSLEKIASDIIAHV